VVDCANSLEFAGPSVKKGVVTWSQWFRAENSHSKTFIDNENEDKDYTLLRSSLIYCLT
jgi:hypothetical protein